MRTILFAFRVHWRRSVQYQCLTNDVARSRRRYSSTLPTTDVNRTRVDVKVGLKATILLSIHHAPRPSGPAPIIIYLPRGPLLPLSRPPISELALSANATVVTIQYRLSKECPYPTAIHDVLAGYDWIQKHLVRSETSHGSVYHPSKSSRVGVCGELIGGGLATMLALTECRAHEPTISAAAIGNPVADWTALFAEESTEKEDSLSGESLLQVRDQLFSKPEHYHDAFASPLLFFRTASSSLPDSYQQQILKLSPEPHADPYVLGEDIPAATERLRRAHRKYPLSGSGLRLPHLRIEVGQQNTLKQQGEDLAERLLKSVKYWEEEAYDSVGHESLEAKIELIEPHGLGFWGEKEAAELGGWFGEVLRR